MGERRRYSWVLGEGTPENGVAWGIGEYHDVVVAVVGEKA